MHTTIMLARARYYLARAHGHPPQRGVRELSLGPLTASYVPEVFRNVHTDRCYFQWGPQLDRQLYVWFRMGWSLGSTLRSECMVHCPQVAPTLMQMRVLQHVSRAGVRHLWRSPFSRLALWDSATARANGNCFARRTHMARSMGSVRPAVGVFSSGAPGCIIGAFVEHGGALAHGCGTSLCPPNALTHIGCFLTASIVGLAPRIGDGSPSRPSPLAAGSRTSPSATCVGCVAAHAMFGR